MRAAVYDRTGAAHDVLRVVDVPTPVPGAGEVRVAVKCSGVNPSDVKSRAGLRTTALPFPRVVPHSDGAGVIDAVGEGVPRTRIGERVWVWNAAWRRADGTAAEYVVLPAEQAVPLPEGIDFAVGACLGIPALTACHAIAVDGGVDGRSVLVAGGAGAVGHYAIQFARIARARRILATVSSKEKAVLARGAGADVVIDYRHEDVAARVRDATGGKGVERIVEVDFAANVATDAEIVAPDGDIVVYGSGEPTIGVPFFPMIVKNVRVRFFIVYNLSRDDRARAIDVVTTALQARRLQHSIAARVPLERIAEAHVLVEQGRAVGNVVVAVAPS